MSAMSAEPSRWLPSTEEELLSALAQGILREGHYLDFKAQITMGNSRANIDLAIDLASMAVDGGCLLIGVAEQSGDIQPVPITLKGLREHVEQVARAHIDPPLSVECLEMQTKQPGLGYLRIVIPTSPTAPHMVRKIYRGRGDATNIKLDD